MKPRYIITGFIVCMALSFSLGWYMQGYRIYSGIVGQYSTMMPCLEAKGEKHGGC